MAIKQFDIDGYLKEHIEECVNREANKFNGYKDAEYSVSDEFNEKIVNMIKSQAGPDNIKPFKQKEPIRKKILCKLVAAMIAITMLCASFVSVSAFSGPIHEFIINTFGKYFTVETSSEYRPNEVTFDYQEPKWLPEGKYEKEVERKTSYNHIVKYKYDNFEIDYSQEIVSNSENKLNNENKNIETETFTVDGREYMYVNSLSNEKNSVYVYDDFYCYKVMAKLDCETLTKIAESIF